MAELREGALTGARRFRVCRLFENHDCQNNGLVLQVQYNTWWESETRPDGKWVTEWRDATPADITPAEDICS
jgi:hypothetical protein